MGILPDALLEDEVIRKLREETSKLEIRMEQTLKNLMSVSVLPWDQWLLSVVQKSENRVALGIPAYLEPEEIVRLIGSTQGFPESMRRTLAQRLGSILGQSTPSVLMHPLCIQSIFSFKSSLHLLTEDIFAYLGWNHLNTDQLIRELRDNNTTNGEKGIEKITRPYWSSFYDPAAMVLLSKVQELRWRRQEENGESADKLKNNLKFFSEMLGGLLDVGNFEWAVTPLWILAEYIANPPLTEKKKCEKVFVEADGGVGVTKDGVLRSPNKFVLQLGVLQEFLDHQFIPYLHAVSPSLVILAKCNNCDNKEECKLSKELSILLERVFLPENKIKRDSFTSEKKMKAIVWNEDRGHLYLIVLKLFAIYEFWRWYAANLLIDKNNASRCCYQLTPENKVKPKFWEKRFKVDSNKNSYLFAKELFEEKGIKKILQERDGFEENNEIKGKDNSVIFLGGAGIGKTAIVDNLYPNEGRVFQITPIFFNTKNYGRKLFDMFNGSSRKDSYSVLFLDEIHIEISPSAYAYMLVPLQDGLSKGLYINEKNTSNNLNLKKVHFVFATSRYRSREEFENDAYRTNSTAMRDFGTRIGNWINLPGLNVVPEHRLVVCGRTDNGLVIIDEKEQLYKYLNLFLKSVRDMTTSKDAAENERKANICYPEWFCKNLVSKIKEPTSKIKIKIVKSDSIK